MQSPTLASLRTKTGAVSAPSAASRLWLLSGLDAGPGALVRQLAQDWPASAPCLSRAAERLRAGLSAAGDAP